MNKLLNLKVGVKTDPVEHRYSYEWLFNILREEDIHDIQLGSFPEMYHLPDSWFLRLRDNAKQYNVDISSVFTSHRE
ncbi:MAG: hypothetical protein FJ263_11590, partial [Planctomycetes bacterium]|nr:hypothetical protein [Planctomycetota bacterium]